MHALCCPVRSTYCRVCRWYIPKVPTNLILLKSYKLRAFTAHFPGSPRESTKFVEIMALFEQGKIDPLIGAEFPITDYAAALNCLSQRKAVGKVVVNL